MVTDTNIKLEAELPDNVRVFSCLNKAGYPYVYLERKGVELASLEVRAPYSKAERILQLVIHHVGGVYYE